MFIRELGEKYNTQDIGCIAENSEKYISLNVKVDVPLGGITNSDEKQVFNKVELRFFHSCRFMPSSLDKLSSNLSDEQCRNGLSNRKTYSS